MCNDECARVRYVCVLDVVNICLLVIGRSSLLAVCKSITQGTPILMSSRKLQNMGTLTRMIYFSPVVALEFHVGHQVQASLRGVLCL